MPTCARSHRYTGYEGGEGVSRVLMADENVGVRKGKKDAGRGRGLRVCACCAGMFRKARLSRDWVTRRGRTGTLLFHTRTGTGIKTGTGTGVLGVLGVVRAAALFYPRTPGSKEPRRETGPAAMGHPPWGSSPGVRKLENGARRGHTTHEKAKKGAIKRQRMRKVILQNSADPPEGPTTQAPKVGGAGRTPRLLRYISRARMARPRGTGPLPRDPSNTRGESTPTPLVPCSCLPHALALWLSLTPFS